MNLRWITIFLSFLVCLSGQPCWSARKFLCDQIFSKNSDLKNVSLKNRELQMEETPLLARVLQGYMMTSFEESGKRWMLILRDQNLVLSPARDLQNQVAVVQPWQDLQLNPRKLFPGRIDAEIQNQILTVTIQEAQPSDAKLIQAKVHYSLEKLLLGRTDQALIYISKAETPLDSEQMASATIHLDSFHFSSKIRSTEIDWIEVRRDERAVEYRISFSKDGSSQKIYSSSFFLPLSWNILQFHTRSEYSRPEKFLLYLLAQTPQGLQNFALFTQSYVQ